MITPPVAAAAGSCRPIRGRSLILLKPTGAVPHKGGLRFAVDSREYRVLAEWIAAGQPAPTPSDPRIERLEILPEHVVLKKGAEQQMLVRGTFLRRPQRRRDDVGEVHLDQPDRLPGG